MRDQLKKGDLRDYPSSWGNEELECGAVLGVYPGGESFHRVELAAGEQLDVTGIIPVGDVALALLDAEGNLVECVDDQPALEVDFLSYVAEVEGTYYLVVDDVYEASTDVYVWSEISTAADLRVYEGRVLQGSSDTVTVVNRSWDFVQDEVTFDLGDGITVDAVRVSDGLGDEAEVDITVGESAEMGDRALSASQGSDTATSDEHALRVLRPSFRGRDARSRRGDVGVGMGGHPWSNVPLDAESRSGRPAEVSHRTSAARLHSDLCSTLLERMPQLARPAKPRSLRPYRAALRRAS